MRQSTVVLFPKRLSFIVTCLFIAVLIGLIGVLASDAAATHTTCPVSLADLQEVAEQVGSSDTRQVQLFYRDLCDLYELREYLAATQPNVNGAAAFLTKFVEVDAFGRELGLVTEGVHSRIPTVDQTIMMLEYLNLALDIEPIALELEKTECGVDSWDEVPGTECWVMRGEMAEETVGAEFQDSVGVVQVSRHDFTFNRVCQNMSLETMQNVWDCRVVFLSAHPGGAEWYCNTHANWIGPGYLTFWRSTDGDMCQPIEDLEPQGMSASLEISPVN